jgi:hypothetical protein
MVFHTELDKVVLFGGEGRSGHPSDTLAWDGKNWAQVATAGPPGRSVHALAYDPEAKKLILFGGANPDLLGDLWEFESRKWTKR